MKHINGFDAICIERDNADSEWLDAWADYDHDIGYMNDNDPWALPWQSADDRDADK